MNEVPKDETQKLSYENTCGQFLHLVHLWPRFLGFNVVLGRLGDGFWPHWIRRHLPDLLHLGYQGSEGREEFVGCFIGDDTVIPPLSNFYAQGSGETMCCLLWFWTHFLGKESSISDTSFLVILRRKECAFLCGFLWAPETINVFIFKCQPWHAQLI